MSKKRLTEEELLEGMTAYNAHADELIATESKDDWLSFAETERVSDDFMSERVDVFDESESNVINPKAFIEELRVALAQLYEGDIELCDLGNEIGRVVGRLSTPHKAIEHELIHGIEHGIDLVAREKGTGNE
ncbi:hypothetical protein L3Q72_13115 [Vibrio sp. JC009]|uniref:hypothetical protein n=1 Tax=Vibrio sp. JC009 TaxID=2912314 RepID=UPI0023AEB2C7|nr:hypothetical protein [Vibrio sp. JC009]WED21553.1 hypothetical protein L3Q72_13115 [Vibrio sp. JC009]